jgi:Fe2+ transport system protein FeoA
LKDPHGAYIPQQGTKEEFRLSDLKEGSKALLLTRQDNEHVMAMLWQLGLSPNFSITILEKSEQELRLKVDGKEKRISPELAAQTQVLRIA